MIWAWMAVAALMVMAPLGWALWRAPRARGRAEADRALFHAQIAELDRELAEGRLEPAAHRDATLEVQRRLLAAPAPEPLHSGHRGTLLFVMLAAPAMALGLYLMRGTPEMPSAGFALRQEVAARDEALLNQLRARIMQLPAGEQRRQGLILLSNAERNRGRNAAAAEALREALAARFDPGLAGDLAEVELARGQNDAAVAVLTRALEAAPAEPRLRFLAGAAEQAAGRPANARSVWQSLLNDTPADAPWRAMLEQRLRGL
jgi:cytochrome c-type biogenesis protein CcmH